MSGKTLNMNHELLTYLLNSGGRESKLLHSLRMETVSDERLQAHSNMQIAPEQGQFLSLLVKLCGTRKALEIGTFTGYSSICIASAMPMDGHLICCDINEEWTSLARRYWCLAGLAEKVDLRIAPALETMHKLLEEGHSRTFDFVFIDADKTSYDAYFEASLRLLRAGGLIAIDNVLWNGKVIDATVSDPDTLAIRRLNQKLQQDKRIDYAMIPVADGLSLCLKR
jgi:predicted O-methyltransferase YrrM